MNTGFIQFFTFSPLPSLASATSASHPQPNRLLQQNRVMTSDPSGSRLLLTMKSHRSSQAEPSANGWNPENLLYPSAVVSASRKTPMPQIRQPLMRPHPVSSRTQARMFSHTASTVDSAANTINRKNSDPHQRPPAMWLNTVAIVSNSRLGPALTSTLNVKQAGKIISPATTATNVSSRMTLTDSPSSVRSLPI